MADGRAQLLAACGPEGGLSAGLLTRGSWFPQSEQAREGKRVLARWKSPSFITLSWKQHPISFVRSPGPAHTQKEETI